MSDYQSLIAVFGLMAFIFYDTAKTFFKERMVLFSGIFFVFSLILFLPIFGLIMLNMQDSGAGYANLGIFLVLILMGMIIAALFYLKVLSPTFKLAFLGMEFGILKDELNKRNFYAKKKTAN
jgi:hypothetical protein